VTTIGDLSTLLHSSVAFPDLTPGRSTIAAPIGFRQHRPVVVRTPDGYRADRPWPLIVVYHTWGGTADRILDRLENLMGDAIEGYVVAAPDDYRQTIIDAPPPVTSEHVSVWRQVRSLWNIDADRTYLAEYSLGGETVVTLAALHPSHIAEDIAMAAGFSFPSDVDGMWEWFLPNLSSVAMVHSWGADDLINVPGLNGRAQDMSLAEQNHRLEPLLSEFGLDAYEHIRLDGVGHTDAYPPLDRLLAGVNGSRSPMPERFTHRFRYIHQADVFWVEGHEWQGAGWLEPWPEVDARPGEDDEKALSRTIDELLGTISASIDGQQVTVDTEHIADLTVWFSDGMIDWERPVSVLVNGSQVFNGALSPSVEVALAQAKRTYDFERIRAAGVRVDVANGTAHVVRGDDAYPDIERGITH
jgi:hypothetical protein